MNFLQIQSITQEEFEHIGQHIGKISEYFVKHKKTTLIQQIYGVFSLKCSDKKMIQFIVLQNPAYVDKEFVLRKYNLRGFENDNIPRNLSGDPNRDSYNLNQGDIIKHGALLYDKDFDKIEKLSMINASKGVYYMVQTIH